MLGSCPICGRSSSSRSSLEATSTRFLTKRHLRHGFACEMWLGKACLMRWRSATGLLMEILYNGLSLRADADFCKLRCSVHVSDSSFIYGNRPTARHIEFVDQCAVQHIDTGPRLLRHWDVVRLRSMANIHVKCCTAKLKSGILGGRYWHTTSLLNTTFTANPNHISNHTANNGLCHKTAQAKIPNDLPILFGSSLESSRAGRKIRSQVQIPRTPICEPLVFSRMIPSHLHHLRHGH